MNYTELEGEIARKVEVADFNYAALELNASGGTDIVSLNFLGRCYETGRGCQKNLQRAFGLYQQAAHFGSDEAQYRLGIMFLTGEACQKNLDTAISLLSAAVQRGHVMARKYLEFALQEQQKTGLCYAEQPKEPEAPVTLTLRGETITFRNMGEYLARLDGEAAEAKLTQDLKNIFRVKETAVQGLDYCYEKRDAPNIKLIYEKVKPFTALMDSTDYNLVLTDWIIEDCVGRTLLAAGEKEGLNHIVLSVVLMERLYRISPTERVKAHLIKQYRQAAEIFEKHGDLASSEKCSIMADRFELL